MLTVEGNGYEIGFVVESLERAFEDASAVGFYVRVDGSKYVDTAVTLDVVSRLMANYENTGECAKGMFFWTSDLVILRDFRPETFLLTVSELISTGDYRRALSKVDDPEES